ncbi:hypothetical protein NPIL_317991 [Nephila pilipes]|uniref:Uncharacterized protein n=1 Tax=Nephila pilipes TaxID=299642 RepID=A0A8X6UNX9_NEPPI|nr:hypothetical protein NPIL_317991 [Nephila pilipes]
MDRAEGKSKASSHCRVDSKDMASRRALRDSAEFIKASASSLVHCTTTRHSFTSTSKHSKSPTQVVSAVRYDTMVVVRTNPLPEGSNRSRAELDRPVHATFGEHSNTELMVLCTLQVT